MSFSIENLEPEAYLFVLDVDVEEKGGYLCGRRTEGYGLESGEVRTVSAVVTGECHGDVTPKISVVRTAPGLLP